MPELSYCAHEVYAHNHDLFLHSLFVPVEQREALLAFYALVVELDKIPGIVSEEMIGHIRYAWWQEALEAQYAGQKKQGHPVLEALASIMESGQLHSDKLMPLIEQYRSDYPAAPANKDNIIKNISLSIISEPEGWLKVDRIITTHRKRYGQHLRSWLMLKLLLA